MEQCLFCTPSGAHEDSDYICSDCTQILLTADQDDLKRAHKAALNRNYINDDHRKACEHDYQCMAQAIDMFTTDKPKRRVMNGARKKTQHPKRSMVRERPMRTSQSSRGRRR